MSAPDSTAPRDGPPVCERKFAADETRADAALAVLSLHCLPDPRYPRGWVESVYFDDPDLSSYREKINGDAFKRKVRIRFYRDSEGRREGPATAWLEIKDRLCAARTKLHAGIPSDLAALLCTPLDDPFWLRLLRAETDALGLPPPERLTPSLSIRYHRHRFVCPATGARIALDTALSSPAAHPGLFPCARPISSPAIVCEAKFPGAATWTWNEPLARLGFEAGSFSKYGLFVEARLNEGT